MWLDIGKALVEIFSKFSEADRKRRDRLSVLFSDISYLLEDTAEQLSRDHFPYGSCAAMSQLASQLSEHVRGKIPEDQFETLQTKLFEATLIEKEYANRKDPRTISAMFEAAGYFKALSIMYKV